MLAVRKAADKDVVKDVSLVADQDANLDADPDAVGKL